MNDRKWAIEVIELWRMRGRIPHAIEISASLIEAMINDNQYLSPNHIRIQYSMVVIRGIYHFFLNLRFVHKYLFNYFPSSSLPLKKL